MTPWDPPWPSSERRAGVDVAAVVLHSIVGPDASGALALLRRHNVSAHYVIDQAGNVYALVPEDRAAWHAGGGRLPDRSAANQRSIGIELVVGSVREAEYSEAQIAALCQLCSDLGLRHPIRWLCSHRAVDARRSSPRPRGEPLRSDPWRFDRWQDVADAIGNPFVYAEVDR